MAIKDVLGPSQGQEYYTGTSEISQPLEPRQWWDVVVQKYAGHDLQLQYCKSLVPLCAVWSPMVAPKTVEHIERWNYDFDRLSLYEPANFIVGVLNQTAYKLRQARTEMVRNYQTSMAQHILGQVPFRESMKLGRSVIAERLAYTFASIFLIKENLERLFDENFDIDLHPDLFLPANRLKDAANACEKQRELYTSEEGIPWTQASANLALFMRAGETMGIDQQVINQVEQTVKVYGIKEWDFLEE